MFFFSKFNSGLISEKKPSYLQTLSPLNLSFDLLVDIKSWVFKERSLSVVSLVRNIMLPSLPDFPKVKKKKTNTFYIRKSSGNRSMRKRSLQTFQSRTFLLKLSKPFFFNSFIIP